MSERTMEDAARVGAAAPLGHRGERRTHRLFRNLGILGALAALTLAPSLGMAEGEKGEMAKEAGVGAGSALVSLVYGPTKILYATGGLIVGGLAWAFSGGDAEVAQVVLTPAVRGDYVITPSQLKGQKEVEFFGRKPEYRPEAQNASAEHADVAAAADGW